MGGTYALRAACELEGFSAAAPFYGDIPGDDVLQNLNTPTIFVSATKDGWIDPEKVARLEDAAERLMTRGPTFTMRWLQRTLGRW